jgi:hypothetical protein
LKLTFSKKEKKEKEYDDDDEEEEEDDDDDKKYYNVGSSLNVNLTDGIYRMFFAFYFYLFIFIYLFIYLLFILFICTGQQRSLNIPMLIFVLTNYCYYLNLFN